MLKEVELIAVNDLCQLFNVATTLSGEYKVIGIPKSPIDKEFVQVERFMDNTYIPVQCLEHPIGMEGVRFGHAVSIGVYTSLLAVSAPYSKPDGNKDTSGEIILYQQFGNGEFYPCGDGHSVKLGWHEWGKNIALSGNGKRMAVLGSVNNNETVMVTRIDTKFRIIPIAVVRKPDGCEAFGEQIWLNANGDILSVSISYMHGLKKIYHYSI